MQEISVAKLVLEYLVAIQYWQKAIQLCVSRAVQMVMPFDQIITFLAMWPKEIIEDIEYE